MAASPDAVLHLAALHTLASAGFASTSRAASFTLSSVLARYLELVASSCTERAALAGRSKVAAIDVVQALEDLGVGGIAELQEWTLDLDKEVVFTGAKLDELAGSLHDGLSITEGVERFYVPVDTDEEDEAADEDERPANGPPDDVNDRHPKDEVPYPTGIRRPASPEKADSSQTAGGSVYPAERQEQPSIKSPEKIGSVGSPQKVDSTLAVTGSASPLNPASPVKLQSPGLPGCPLKVEPGSPVKVGSPIKIEGSAEGVSLAKGDTLAVKGSPGNPTDPGQIIDNGVTLADSDVEMTEVKHEEETDNVQDKDVVADTVEHAKMNAGIDKENAMDVDAVPMRPQSPQLPTPPPSPPYLRVDYRPRSPDMSWLPPLPKADVLTVSATGADVGDTVPAPQSIADRYRMPVAYRTSQLAEAHSFAAPPKPPKAPNLPPAPTSFPSLVTTYEATLTEPSVALRQTDGRRQAADLLRLTVGNPDRFSIRDTLASPLPPPHISPIVPSHSDVFPPRLLPVNPNQNGVISSILHQMRTPYLPSTLRERLTSLRPPQLQNNDNNQPALYGPPVRGADDAALAKARGKATGEEATATLRATWDSGPKGQDKWSRGRLPTGRKVVHAVEGATAPREANNAKGLRLKVADRVSAVVAADLGTPAFSPATTLKLRLGAGASAGGNGATKMGTPTSERARPSLLTGASVSDLVLPTGSTGADDSNATAPPPGPPAPIRLFAQQPKGGSTSPTKSKRTHALRKSTSMSPVKPEPMQLD